MPKPKQAKGTTDYTAEEFSALLAERASDNHVDESLKAIYKTEARGGLKRKTVDPLARLAWTFLVFLLLLTVISWTGFYLLNQGERLRSADITFAIAGPVQTVAGKTETFDLQYKNVSAFDLRNIVIRLSPPASFIFVDAAPAPVSQDDKEIVWEMDEVITKRSGRIAVQGRVIAPAGAAAELSAVFAYRPENFSSTFRAQTRFATAVAATGVNVSVAAPSFANVNEPMPITVTYAREHESYLDGFTLVLDHGASFALGGENSEGVWDISELTERAEELAVEGVFNKVPASDETLMVRAGVPYDVTETRIENGAEVAVTETRYRWLFEQPLPVVVVDGALGLTLSLNGGVAAKPVSPNDELNYIVHYKNTSEATLRNIIVLATLTSDLLNWNTLRDDYGGERSDNAIIWTKAEIADFATLTPDAEGSFGFSIRLKDGSVPANAAVRATLDYSVDSAPLPSDTHAVELVSPVNTAVSFTGQLRYFDANNNAVGEGPLPPRVGATTTYRGYWFVSGNVHDLADATISVVLPERVSWQNNATQNSGSMAYDSGTRTLTWQAPRVDAAGEPVVAEFVVSVTPAASDRNKVITILNEAALIASDAATGGAVRAVLPPKTTALDDDAAGRGKGEVE